MSRPDKEAYLNRYKGQRRRKLNFPDRDLSSEEEIIEYFNKCEEMVDTILVKEHSDDKFRMYIDPLSYDLYEDCKEKYGIVDNGDYKYIDEKLMIEPFKQALIKATKDYFSKISNKIEAFTKDNKESTSITEGTNKYKITYYKNSAAAERRPTTKRDIKKDWIIEKKSFNSDLKALEYVFKKVLDYEQEDLDDMYEDLDNPNDDKEKMVGLISTLKNQDLGSGDSIIISIIGPSVVFDSEYTKEDFMGEDLEEKLSLEEALTLALMESVDWNYFDKFKQVNDIYMPDEGEGDTLASQIVTAINKLVYKWYNDGDVFDNVHSSLSGWANDLSSYANWLDKYCKPAAKILDSIYSCTSDEDYENLLKALADKCLDIDYLKTMEQPSQGSIYECKGQYEFKEEFEDEDDDWEDYSIDYEEDEDEDY